MAFARDIQNHLQGLQRRARTLVPNVAMAVDGSIRYGSPVTGAPGQPVDKGTLVNSWHTEEVEPYVWQTSTPLDYAPHVEDNVRGVTFQNHGPHSVKLTRAGFPALVEHENAKLR